MVTAREPRSKIVGLRRDYTPTLTEIAKAYLLGSLQDGTERKTTWRISQKCKEYLFVLKDILKHLGAKSWIYKEGLERNVWILEFSKSILDKKKIQTKQEKIAFLRGFWDADGGIAKSPKVKFYIYFAQKNKEILMRLKCWLNALNIKTGKLHNPSKRVDPDYWRFYISTSSHSDYAKKIGSWHPEKSNYLLKVKR